MKSIKIQIPEGHEIDEENSTFECVKFKPSKEKQEFQYVDLGLPSGTLWATCNVGANTIDDRGSYLTFNGARKYNLPKQWQFQELIEECNWEWDKLHNGYLVTGLNGNYIFLPAEGYLQEALLYDDGSCGFYWSYTPYTNFPNLAHNLYFCQFTIRINCRNIDRISDERYSVRSVKNTKNLKK